MATSLSSVHKSSDLVKDYCCGACESKHIEESADFYCETCLKCFCEECNKLHSQLYAKHSTFGRGEMKDWPLTKKMEDFLQKCEVHKDEKLKMFCQDHSQLCCTYCAFLNHRQCTNVTLISESVRKQTIDLQQLSDKIQNILEELKTLENNREASVQSVEALYNERLQEVRDVRQKLNAALDEIEKTTLRELDGMRKTLQASLKTDVENCTRFQDELEQLLEAVQYLGGKSTEELSFIASKKCLDKIQQSEAYLKENSVKEEGSITFQANTDIEQYLAKQSGLGMIAQSDQSLTLQGKTDQMICVNGKSEYNVQISNDLGQNVRIIALSCLPNGEILVADADNKRIKLLDQKYRVVSHCDVSDALWDMCPITSNELVVTVDSGNTHEIQFISVTNGQLVKGRKLPLQHDSVGIAHHQGALYVTSRTALYHFTLTGSLVKKLYEDKSGLETVWKCAVSPTGDKIYVTNYLHHKLLTLARDGTLLCTFTDPELRGLEGVHVTPAGQVLVCGRFSNTILQVDREGRKKLATLATKIDGVNAVLSVYYNRFLASIMVGQCGSTNILLLEVQ